MSEAISTPLGRGEHALISIRRISLGGGFRYLLDSVAAGDEDTPRHEGLAAYYAASGTPPGRFLGAGLADLDGGRGVPSGEQVTEEHLFRMLVELADPVSGEPLGGAPKAPARGAVPVAGFDLTFSPSKSVSVAWALADEATKSVIYDCHRRAVEYVLGYAERHVFRSRSGKAGVVEEDVSGVVATAFTHWSSRADDPQLHDHCVIWNRARSVSDGRWRTLDSRALFKATTTLSELHQGVLSDLLTDALGYGFEPRSRRHSDRPRFEIAGVLEELMAEFSRRSEQVAEHSAGLVSAFVAAHGRHPTVVESERLRSQATIATRPVKARHSLAELTRSWRERAGAYVEADEQTSWAASLAGRNSSPLLIAADLPEDVLADVAAAVLAEVSGRRSAFGRLNLLAEAHRALHGVRFLSPAERTAAAELVTDLAVAESLLLTPPARCHTPAAYMRADGSSRLRPTPHALYTTTEVLQAEARLLEAGRKGMAPTVSLATVAVVLSADLHGDGQRLGLDQALAVEHVATSGRALDVLVGPSGSGKSTTMAGLRAVWEAEHGRGSVVGLAPSAAAADVLAESLGVPTENTAKWLTEHRRVPELIASRNRLRASLARHPHPRSAHATTLRDQLATAEAALAERCLRPGQLVIVDEATLAGTLALDELVLAARPAGAKVLLVGDFAQIGAVEAGGAFSLIVRERDRVPELTDVRRFRAPWERQASLDLRLGREDAIGAYDAHGRVLAGDRERLLDAIHEAWAADVASGRSSLMVAPDGATVVELNRRARAARVAAGLVQNTGVELSDGTTAGAGDEVVARRNDRSLVVGSGWVKNGDRFIVVATEPGGALRVRRTGGGSDVVLPAGYVADNVELGYASTAFRSQGRTVDAAHVLVSPTTSREVLYVGATRGRETNRLYVETAFDPDPQTSHDALTPRQAAGAVLRLVLANDGSELSAHEAMDRARREADDLATLAAEYETLAQYAETPRIEALLARSGLAPHELEIARQGYAFGPLVALVRHAEASGLEVELALRRVVAARAFDDADDPAAVLHGRIERWADCARSTASRRGFVAGVVPRVAAVADEDMARALEEREAAIRRLARELALLALARRDPWVLRLGPAPVPGPAREGYLEALAAVAAFRERWHVTDREHPVGDEDDSPSIEGRRHRDRALIALRDVLTLGDCGLGAVRHAPPATAPIEFSPAGGVAPEL